MDTSGSYRSENSLACFILAAGSKKMAVSIYMVPYFIFRSHFGSYCFPCFVHFLQSTNQPQFSVHRSRKKSIETSTKTIYGNSLVECQYFMSTSGDLEMLIRDWFGGLSSVSVEWALYRWGEREQGETV